MITLENGMSFPDIPEDVLATHRAVLIGSMTDSSGTMYALVANNGPYYYMTGEELVSIGESDPGIDVLYIMSGQPIFYEYNADQGTWEFLSQYTAEVTSPTEFFPVGTIDDGTTYELLWTNVTMFPCFTDNIAIRASNLYHPELPLDVPESCAYPLIILGGYNLAAAADSGAAIYMLLYVASEKPWYVIPADELGYPDGYNINFLFCEGFPEGTTYGGYIGYSEPLSSFEFVDCSYTTDLGNEMDFLFIGGYPFEDMMYIIYDAYWPGTDIYIAHINEDDTVTYTDEIFIPSEAGPQYYLIPTSWLQTISRLSNNISDNNGIGTTADMISKLSERELTPLYPNAEEEVF